MLPFNATPRATLNTPWGRIKCALITPTVARVWTTNERPLLIDNRAAFVDGKLTRHENDPWIADLIVSRTQHSGRQMATRVQAEVTASIKRLLHAWLAEAPQALALAEMARASTERINALNAIERLQQQIAMQRGIVTREEAHLTRCIAAFGGIDAVELAVDALVEQAEV